LAGTNDYSANRTQGSAASAFTGASPITGNNANTILDIATAIRYVCETLLNAYPDVQIILATPLQRGMDDNTPIFQIGQVIKDCAAMLAVGVIDQGKESGIYGKYDVSTHKYLRDGTHPTDAGNEKIGSFIATKLKNIICI
jgi:lysophospholipase L1-like esterase